MCSHIPIKQVKQATILAVKKILLLLRQSHLLNIFKNTSIRKIYSTILKNFILWKHLRQQSAKQNDEIFMEKLLTDNWLKSQYNYTTYPSYQTHLKFINSITIFHCLV